MTGEITDMEALIILIGAVGIYAVLLAGLISIARKSI